MKSSAKSQLVAFTLLLWTQSVSVPYCVAVCKLNHNSFHQLDSHSLRNELCVYVKMMQFLDVQTASFSDVVLSAQCEIARPVFDRNTPDRMDYDAKLLPSNLLV